MTSSVKTAIDETMDTISVSIKNEEVELTAIVKKIHGSYTPYKILQIIRNAHTAMSRGTTRYANKDIEGEAKRFMEMKE